MWWRMKVLLGSYHNRFSSQILIVTSALSRASLQRSSGMRLDRYARQEGLISILWQIWNYFCKRVIVESSLGSITTSGSVSTSQFSHLSEDRLLYVCRHAARNGGNLRRIGVLRGSFEEPTWGDAVKIDRMVNYLNPSNKQNLLSGFGLRTLSMDLQKVRNACAHISHDNIEEIKNLQLTYASRQFNHPSDALLWIEPITGHEAWKVWVDELRASAVAAIV